MTDQRLDHLRSVSSTGMNGRPVRKDEMELADRGVYVESWLPERRSRRKPLLFVHDELAGSWLWERYLGYFAGRGWEGHALNLRNHYWSQTADAASLTFESYVGDVVAVAERMSQPPVIVGHGMGGLLVLKAAERQAPSAIVLLDSDLPRDLRAPVQPHELRDVPDVYGKALLGWETLPEKLQRDHRDLSLADVLRIQHMLGEKPHESGQARRAVLRGIAVDRRRLEGLPILVVGAGLDRERGGLAAERLADWLGASFEPYAAHSHYGLVMGEGSFQQVAEGIRAFLEGHRL